MLFLISCPLIFMAFSYYLTYEEFRKENDYFKHNKFRVLTSRINVLIEEYYRSLYDPDFQKRMRSALTDIEATLKITDLSGKVFFSSIIKEEQTDFVNLKQDIHFDAYYEKQNSDLIRITNPIVINNTVQGLAIYELPKKYLITRKYREKTNKVILPVFISLMFSLCIIVIVIMQFIQKFYFPIKRLNYYANEISEGNLDVDIKYMGNDEMKQCCIAFDRMKTELKESLKIQAEYEKSKKEIIACISHDLKTPISSIRASAEGLIDGIAKEENMRRMYYGIIHKKILSLDKLVDDLFYHSQMELKKLEIIKKEQYLNDMLEKIIRPLEDQFALSFKTLIVIRPFPNVLVSVDSDRIYQAIVNLIRNAEKYSDDGDEIMIGCEKKNNFVAIYVKDTGCGISKEDLPFIFDKFYRGEKARSSNLGGSGLGLAICKYIIKEHYGDIEVKSKLGEGSTFTILLPIV